MVRELLEEFAQFINREPFHPVVLCVPGSGSTAQDGSVVVVYAAVGIPQVVRDVDSLDIVLDNPVVCRWDGTDQNISLRAPVPEKVGELGLVDPPGVLVQFGVLWNHVGQGEGGIAARDCQGKETAEGNVVTRLWESIQNYPLTLRN